MKYPKCKWHKLAQPCKKCAEDLQKTGDKLNEIFNGLVINMDKDGNPIVYRESK